MKLGARIIKTGIAVTISLYVAELIGLSPIVFAALAAVLAIQPSLYRSWQNILEQLQANTIGALFAVLFTSSLGNEPFVVGLVVIMVIAINIQLKFENSIPLSIVTVIAIMESTTGNFFMFALERFMLILTGIGSSVLVNIIFLPPRYEDKLYSKIQSVNQSVLSYLRSGTFREFEDQTYRDEIKRLRDEFIQTEQLYLLFKEERTYFRRVKYSKTRKLVLFRKMLQVTNKALHLLSIFEKHQADFASSSEQLQSLVHREIELLSNYHEKILLKYEGKLKIHHPHHPYEEVFQGKRKLLEHFMKVKTANIDLGDEHKEMTEEISDEWMTLFPLIALIIDYSSSLERLDKLVEGYHTFH